MSAVKMIPPIPSLAMGGAGFSYQLHPRPESLPVVEIVRRAFDLGLRTIDTSPYYEPSEQLLGDALSHSDITSFYKRNDYTLMTKVGRIAADHFDYSPKWIRHSVQRSLERLRTTFLDVVFCHDVEFVTRDEAVDAIGVLFELQDAGIIRRVGISGYDIEILVDLASRTRLRYGKPLNVVQNWAQLTLQNTRLEQVGLARLKERGVSTVYNASPLAVGLLRSGGVPVGALGDWHPAPPGLRAAAKQAADFVSGQGESLAPLALRYSIRRAAMNSDVSLETRTIIGVSSIADLEENVEQARKVLFKPPETAQDNVHKVADGDDFDKDLPLTLEVRKILDRWVDYDFSR